MINRRHVGIALFTSLGTSSAQPLAPVRLLLVRRPGLSPTNHCAAPCIRGELYDVTDMAGRLDEQLLPTLTKQLRLCDVIERPWKNNKPNVSSVPKGTYKARIRDDKTKDWMDTTDKRWRLELQKAGPRSAIQFHYGKDVHWSEGCFIVGSFLQSGDAGGITNRYCELEGGEAAVARIRLAVTAPRRNSTDISVGVADDAGLFPGLSPRAPC